MSRFVCIHGHFYQPPRENPWTDRIDLQPSAAPFPNWNYRIARECYRANTKAQIMDGAGEVETLVNNYGYISFNFGPTLLRWLNRNTPEVHESIVHADKLSIERFGHGSAMAQVYHHAILPLCNARDKQTEVLWGLADFEHRFGRKAEGIWLAETAVDLPSLEALAQQGILFTILAPRQAAAVRNIDESDWHGVDEGSLDTSCPYRVNLPSGRHINVFFYNGDLAQDVAFKGALNNGETFAHRILRVAESVPENGIVHYATDGESYGHHHRYGEMALAFCLKTLFEMDGVELCNYASYLRRNPPAKEAMIHEPSSWSCVHGVGRWSENCGCTIDPRMEGKQQWRRTLRDALNALRDVLGAHFESAASEYIHDPWSLRDEWLAADLNDKTTELIQAHAKIELSASVLESIQDLMKVQRFSLMMFTSCGWFFDDPAGLEPVQILRYAYRAIEIHFRCTGEDLKTWFRQQIIEMRSVEPETPTGAEIWDKLVSRNH